MPERLKSIFWFFPLRSVSVTPDAGVGFGRLRPGKQLKPTAVMKGGGGPRPLRTSLTAPHAPANFLHLPARGSAAHVSTRPHLPPGRWLSHSPSLRSHSPRVRRTVNPSLRDRSRLDLGISGQGRLQPAPLRSSTPPQESPPRHWIRLSSGGRIHSASETPQLLGPRPTLLKAH